MAFYVGCQTITFGDASHRDDIRSVLEAVSTAGYDGAEIGFFRLNPEKGPEYRELFDALNLKLAAVHVGGNILDVASQNAQMDNLDLVIRMVQQLGGSEVFLSGNRTESYSTQAARYEALGERLDAAGLTLGYHNHDWEIKDNCAGLTALLENSKYMSLVLDVGWVTQAGGDPVKVIKDFAPRLRHVHFKEFTAEGGFAELGTGVVNFRGVYDAVKALGKDMWIVAEQDQSKKGAAASIKENCSYIKGLLA